MTDSDGPDALSDLDAASTVRMRWNTPLSQEHADLLLRRLDVRPGSRVLDLGCGWGELLLQAVAAGGTEGPVPTTGIGVDTSAADLRRGRELAAERSLSEHVAFVEQDAATWREPADRVLCVGASHTLGGTVPALKALDDPRARQVREKLDVQLSEYVSVYRGILGLGYFVLGR
jgi:SAM-dependent methyltransferase